MSQGWALHAPADSRPSRDFVSGLVKGTYIMNTSERILITAEEAAQLLGLSRSKIYVMVASGELDSRKIGRAVRLRYDAVLAFAAGN